ncbi:methyltransferase domain-containing protein [Bradyrhizobium hereditatis]|uniref:methyltransferase domain-containing protein n=1 Tax=Bradyrhizobium hereditatis TaxID=2821405 RepID=UPI001CE2FBCE|nr:methyltransferase domain-containing protein [Bradyrhizobium hereditatis]
MKASERVLDIGTGTGRLAEFVAGLVGPQGRVIGIDPLSSYGRAWRRLRGGPTVPADQPGVRPAGRSRDASCDYHVAA